ncbi:MAG: DUF6603 domain-containing protein, partial [Scytonema sp. PMC 1069.18]|nr:DUF6603 domain-containing protein [Scytonema sp. PMC 1069.18]
TKIDGYISNNILALSSQNNDLNSPNINSAINTYFAGNMTGIVQFVNGDTATIENEQVIYRLSLDTQNFSLYNRTSTVEATIAFFVNEDIIQFTIEAIMREDYRFADSFSELANKPTLPINQVTLANSVFTIQSEEQDSVDFRAKLQATGPLVRIAWMVIGELNLIGKIHFQAVDNIQIPILNLQANIPNPLSFGIFSLDTAIRLKSDVHPIPNNIPSYLFLSQVELVTEFKTDKLTIPVIMPLYGKEQYLLSFYLDLAKPKPTINSLNDLSGFTDNNDPTNLLDVEISLDRAKFSLDSVSVVVDPVARQLVNIQIGISFDLNWTIIQNTLELERVGAVFIINNPSQPKKENIGVYLYTELKVASIFLETSVLLPDKVLQAQLEQGSEIDVNEVINTLARGVTLPGDDELKIYDLEIYAQVKKGEEAYSFQAAASGNLTIINGLVINNIALFIEYQNKSLSDVRLSSTLTLTQVGAELFLLANYRNENGWDFQGNTGLGQEIPIGDLIEDIANLFGEVTLPSVIEDLTIQNLGLSFNTKTKDFTFTCQSKFPVDDQEVDITVTINITSKGNSFQKEFGGYILISGLQFNLIFSKDNTAKTFLATYNNPNRDSLQIKTLVEAVSDDIATYIPATLEITLQDALFIYSKNQTKSNFLFGLNLGSQINLSNLPLVGKQFPPEQTVGVDDLQFLIASQNINPEQVNTFNNLIPDDITKLPLQPTGNNASVTVVKKGLNVSANLQVGNTTQILALPITSDSQPTTPILPPSATAVTTPPPTPVTDNTQWYPLKKQLGPVYFGRIGIQYQDTILWFLLDASISAAGLTLNLDGLLVGSPLKQFQPKFNLRGIGIEYESKGNISIEGAFLRTTINGKDDYSGTVIVKTETFSISAIGSYTTADEGHPSLFIYGILDKPIGGPPFFFITGLALGFAYNRSLILPTLDQIPQFPLVKAALNGAKANPAGLIAIQRELQPYIPPKVGRVMLAVGIKFTSFKIIESFVLLVATFGDRFSLELLGISTLISPPIPPRVNPNTLPPPLAQVRFGILARYVPSEGTLKVEGKILPDSYLFDRNCRLSGGFAFYSWFSGQYEGDFVLTVGGYHPRFQIPPHYPRVAPLALNWRISNELSVKGSLYFALTASAIMAGGRLEAVWQSGNIKAWFIANAHFIVAWQPYSYDARIGVNLGASYTFWFFGRQTISIEVGADLHIWGPEFSGTATIKLAIVSFTVRFGDRSQKKPPALKWEEFKASFLPAGEQVCTIAVESGLLRKLETVNKEEIFIVNPKEFAFTTSSVIPLKNVEAGKISIKQQTESGVTPTTTFGIAPMDVNKQRFTESKYSISIVKVKEDNSEETQGSNFECTPISKNIPTALWGESNSKNPNRERFINNVLSGYKIKPANPPTPGETQPIERKNLAYDTELVDNAYEWNSFSTFSKSEETDEDTREKNIGESITSEDVKNARNSLLESLGLSDIDIDLEEFETDKGIEQAFIIAPQLEEVTI